MYSQPLLGGGLPLPKSAVPQQSGKRSTPDPPLAEIQQHSAFGYWLVAGLFAAILAALMSTADLVLLSISSMLTKDLYARYLRPQACEAELIRVGKLCSRLLIAALVSLAIAFCQSTSLVDLLDRKLDLMAQLVPVFMAGLHWSGLRAGPTFVGMATGIAVTQGIVITTGERLADFHPGLYGLITNLIIAVCSS